MGFLVMILDYIVSGKFSVLFHDTIFLSLVDSVCFFALFFVLRFSESNFI